MNAMRNNKGSTTPDNAIELLLEEIANTAFLTEKRLRVTPGNDPELHEHEIDTLREVIARLGWIADLGLKRLGSMACVHEGDAAAWLLSPATSRSLTQGVHA